MRARQPGRREFIDRSANNTLQICVSSSRVGHKKEADTSIRSIGETNPDEILFPGISFRHLVEEAFFLELLQETHIDELLRLGGLGLRHLRR